jgi:4-hydroxybenzoate polyprenyltransferase
VQSYADGEETSARRVSPKEYILASVRTLKPHVQLSAMMPVLLGMVVSLQGFPRSANEWLVLLGAALFYTGAISAFNDFLDREPDAVNHPNRLLVSGLIRPSLYLILFVGTFTLAGLLVFALITTTSTFSRVIVILVIIEGLHLLYALAPDLGGKGFVRQSLLGIGVMLLVLLGGLAAGDFSSDLGLSALAVGIFICFGMIGKDVADVLGDRTVGLITIPGSLGIRTAGWISALGHVPALALVTWMVFDGRLSQSALLYLVIAGSMVGLSCAYFVRGKYGRYWGIPMLMAFASQFVFEFGIIMGTIARWR